jgi:hypothetical protein
MCLLDYYACGGHFDPPSKLVPKEQKLVAPEPVTPTEFCFIMTFYLTDESQFVATYRPSSNNTYNTINVNNNDTMAQDYSYFDLSSYRGAPASTTTTPTGSLSPPRTRLVNNVMNHTNSNQQREQQQQQQQPQTSQHHRDKSSGGMSFSDAFSYIDSICSGSQSFDDHISGPSMTPSPPPSVIRESSPMLSPMTPYDRTVLQQKRSIQNQPQAQNLPSASNSIMTPISSSSSSSYSPNTYSNKPSYTLQLQNKAQEQAQKSRNHVLPKVTAAAAPFEKMIAPSSYLYGELLKEPGYRHALEAGTLWQSLCSQHVHFPALWYDGDEPARPPMGCSRKGVNQQHSVWKYFGRHRVQGDLKLNGLIGNRGSSGRLLLHIVVTSPFGAVADVCVGCFHPNARGVRMQRVHDPALEPCRDVWTGHRQRDTQKKSRIEQLLQHYNKGLVDITPLGGAGSKQANHLTIDNRNLKAVFGARSPLFTLFVPEDELYDLLQRNVSARCPASIVLMRQYLREEEFQPDPYLGEEV